MIEPSKKTGGGGDPLADESVEEIEEDIEDVFDESEEFKPKVGRRG